MTSAGLGPPLDPLFFHQHVEAVARGLIGATLLVNGVGGTVVETEAYDSSDPASHSFAGPGRRNAVMFGPPAHAYVYRIYGLHWCLNAVAGQAGSAVLVRAIQPTHGVEEMIRRRGTDNARLLCSGPGRLCEALGIDGSLNGASLADKPFALFAPSAAPLIAVGGRIGIRLGADTPWRFGLRNSPFLSRPMSGD